MCVDGKLRGEGSYFNQWVKTQTRKNIVQLLFRYFSMKIIIFMSLKTLACKVLKMLAIDGQTDGWKDGQTRCNKYAPSIFFSKLRAQ